MPIKLLPSEVASQIAAGEVIERPASVVKELIENALDAQAHIIAITSENAGRRLIEVADDGTGIPAEEISMAVERHATSKLSKAEDLFHIQTLGFRGEALASIGSVARMTLTSCTAGAKTGARLRVEGGRVSPPETYGGAVGTVVRVEDLFFNVPARLKFLKHETTERRLIDTLVTRYALAYPFVRFQLRQESQLSLQTSGKGDRREVLAALYGAETARQMLEVQFLDQEITINGFISPTALTRSNRREMVFFVNGRPVQDTALSAALLKGYHTYLMVGRYPVALLFLEIPAESVDVNVHPTKAEVRFRNPDAIFSGVQHAVRRALLAYNPVQGWETDPGSFTYSQPGGSSAISASAISRGKIQQYPPEPSSTTFEGTLLSSQARPHGPTTAKPAILRWVGQIANTYLAAEGPDGLYLIDQHAAHERVLFERYLRQRSQGIPSQALLQPAVVELPPHSARALEEQLGALNDLGFTVEAFGPASTHTFLVRSIPVLLAGGDPSQALLCLVGDFEEDETPLQSQQEARLIARICKRMAIKGGQTLSPEEQKTLLSDLESCQSPRTCPHGRPTMIHLSVDLLERQFGRKGAR